MKMEIERKFLVVLEDGRIPSEIAQAPVKLIQQGYLSTDPKRVVRVRTVEELDSEKGFITIKGKGSISRPEWEFEVPFLDALGMLNLALGDEPIVKTRSQVGRFEVDIFQGQNQGMIVAEIELESEDEQFERPAWLGEEVTHDSRYSNMNLVNNPYEKWRNG